jgi:glycosyltransferase involved in cell wall biosynthesis
MSNEGEGRQSLRILYAAGPGNVIGTYRAWKSGGDDPSQVNMTLSGMFYDMCRARGDTAYVLSTCPIRGEVRDGNFRIRHRAAPFADRSGMLYHLGQLLMAARIIAAAICFGADVALIDGGTCHWFPLRILPWVGIRVVPTLHCVLWKKYRPLSCVTRLAWRLNRAFFTRSAHCVLSMSRDITAQLDQLTALRRPPVHQFLPTYRVGQFDDVAPVDASKRPFRVFYAGRIERNKGVFDLLAIARRFKAQGIDDVVFDICGSGGAYEQLKANTQAAGVADRFLLHGFCNQPAMRKHYEASHVVIVPTTSDFVEGFNQVVAEAVLAGRPAITSAVCPAIDYVHEAAIEVPVDDVQAYGDAILALRNDPDLYRAKVEACAKLQAPFYDLSLGWGAALEGAMRPLRGDDTVEPALKPRLWKRRPRSSAAAAPPQPRSLTWHAPASNRIA